MQNEFKKLSPRQQKGAIVLSKQAVKLKELLVEVRGMDEQMKRIETLALSLQQYCNSENLHSQVIFCRLLFENLFLVFALY